MTRLLILILFASATLSASAIDLFKKKEFVPFDYTAWCDTANLPSGNRDIYPKTVEGTAVINGSIPMTGIDDKNAFAAAICHAVETLDPAIEKLEHTDYAGNSFIIMQRTTRGSNNTEATYTRRLMVEVANGQLNFTVYDIDIRYREKGVIPRTLPLEKLNPAENSRHRELIVELADINASYINSMCDFIKKNPLISFGDIDAMSKGEATPGMSETEIKVLLGKPTAIRNSGSRTRWIYSNDLIIIFTDGKVTKIVN